MSKIETYIVDSFTDQVFRGNPAGVCMVKSELEENLMLSIAKELGLSETAFIKELILDQEYSIRFFSPKMEIPLCGHATLAASKVIFDKSQLISNINFITGEGLVLAIARNGDDILMEFPLYDVLPKSAPEEILFALGIEEICYSGYNVENKILMIEIGDCNVLRDLQPDFEKLKRSYTSINGVSVTSVSDKPEYDFESRYFWPWSGTNEDPVTGGTHTFLTKYWSEKLNKTRMKSFQCSERTGFMELELINDHKFTIKSKAQIVLKGELSL